MAEEGELEDLVERLADKHGPLQNLQALEAQPTSARSWEALAQELARDQEWDEALLAAIPVVLLGGSCSDATARVLRRGAAATLPKGWTVSANASLEWALQAVERAPKGQGTVLSVGGGLGLAAIYAATCAMRPARTLVLSTAVDPIEPLIALALRPNGERRFWVELEWLEHRLEEADEPDESLDGKSADVLLWEVPAAGLNQQLVQQVCAAWELLPAGSQLAPLTLEVWALPVQADHGDAGDGQAEGGGEAARDTLRRLLRCEPTLCATTAGGMTHGSPHGDGFDMGRLSAAMVQTQAAFPIALEQWRHTALAPPVCVLRWMPAGPQGDPVILEGSMSAARAGTLDALVTWTELEVSDVASVPRRRQELTTPSQLVPLSYCLSAICLSASHLCPLRWLQESGSRERRQSGVRRRCPPSSRRAPAGRRLTSSHSRSAACCRYCWRPVTPSR